jgi:hypothetical protein
MMRLPDADGGGRGRIAKFVGMPDVMPTILEFLDLQVPETVQGHSLVKIANGEYEPPGFGISGHYGRSWSIRNEEWSFYMWPGGKAPYTWGIGYPEPSENDKNPELYRLDNGFICPTPSQFDPERDVAERANIIGERPEIARGLELDLRRFIQGLTPSAGDIMAQEAMKTELRQPWLYGIIKG